MYSSHVSTILLRRFNPNIPQNVPKNVLLLGHWRYYGKFGGYGRRIGVWFGEQSAQVARACTRQFESIAAQRVRRTIQLFNLYGKIWDEVALREFMRSWRRRIGRNTREFFISAVGVTMYNWDGERISDQELYSYSKEIEGIYKLRDATVVCEKCQLRLMIDVTQPGIEYCRCHGTKAALVSIQKEIDWQPFIERKDMLVWRKEEPNTGGLYAYKVFGTFSDVSAEDFLQVQVDVDYRKVWDLTAKRLEIIDSDPQSKMEKDQQSDVVYWEMTWPRLFSNRDYVYERRWIVDRDRGIVVIVSKVTDHPDAPNRPDTYRVTTYWSYMVIKPCTEFHEPGIEFGLTYFDDPGVNIPSAVTAWVAMSGLPDFLCRMREAAKDYKKYNTEKQEQTVEPERESTANNRLESAVDAPIEIVLEFEETIENPAAVTVQDKEPGVPPQPRMIPQIIQRPLETNEPDESGERKNEVEDQSKEFESEKGSLTESQTEQEHGETNSNGENKKSSATKRTEEHSEYAVQANA